MYGSSAKATTTTSNAQPRRGGTLYSTRGVSTMLSARAGLKAGSRSKAATSSSSSSGVSSFVGNSRKTNKRLVDNEYDSKNLFLDDADMEVEQVDPSVTLLKMEAANPLTHQHTLAEALDIPQQDAQSLLLATSGDVSAAVERFMRFGAAATLAHAMPLQFEWPALERAHGAGDWDNASTSSDEYEEDEWVEVNEDMFQEDPQDNEDESDCASRRPTATSAEDQDIEWVQLHPMSANVDDNGELLPMTDPSSYRAALLRHKAIVAANNHGKRQALAPASANVPNSWRAALLGC